MPAYRQVAARTHNNLAVLLADMGRLPAAEEQYRTSLAINQKLVAELPAVARYRDELATAYNNLGFLLIAMAIPLESEAQHRKALALRETLSADYPAVPKHREMLAISHNNLGIALAELGKKSEAEEQFREGLAIQERLAASFPGVPHYQVDVGGSCCNIGKLATDAGRSNESLDWYEKAIRTLTTVHQQDHRLMMAKLFLRNSYTGRATVYEGLQKHDLARPDWDRAIELAPSDDRWTVRADRALSRVKIGQTALSVAEVDELAALPNRSPEACYTFVCIYAIAGGKVAEKKQAYADRAIQLLTRAVNAGYRSAEHMKQDPDLNSVRHRDDFQRLVAGLESGNDDRKKP